MRITLAAMATLSFVAFAGCTPPPPLDFTIQDIGMVKNRKNAELKLISVGFASQSEQGIMQTNETLPPIWKEALTDTIARSLIFRDGSNRKVNLSVRITTVDTPEVGLDLTTKVAAIYEIIDTGNGNLVFSEKIETSGTVPFNYAALAITRARESANRAVRNNIAEFIKRLEASDINKPVFR